MTTALRVLFAALVGFALALVIISGMEVLGQQLFPAPPGLNPATPDGFRAILAAMPPLAWGWLLLGYALASLVGAWLAVLLAGRHMAGAWVLTALLTAAGIGNLLLLPHPAWFWFASLPVYPIFGFAGGRLIARRRRVDLF